MFKPLYRNVLTLLLTAPIAAHTALADGAVYNYDHSGTFASTGSGHADVIDMVVNAGGEIYTTGPYSGTVDFDDSTGVNSLSGGGTYLAKRNADGSFAWVIKWIGVINGLTMDTAGNLYLTGGFSNTVDFDPTSGVDQKTAEASVSTYITQLKPDGSYGWTLAFSGSGQNAGNDIAMDNQGAIYVTGEFRNSVNFNTDGGNDTLTSLSGSLDGFVTKLNADTSYAWTEQFGDGNSEVGHKIVVDDTANTYVLDNNRGAFGTSQLNTSLRKFLANGTADFVLTFDNDSGSSEGFSLSISGSEIYVGGGYIGTVDFDPTSGLDVRTSTGGSDGFVSEVGTDGSYAWTQTLGDTQDDYVRSVLADGNGNLFVAGSFRGSVDFSYGASTDIRTAVAFMDSFITRMDTNGNPVWTNTLGRNAHDWTKAMAMDANGNIYQGGKVNAVASSSRSASNWDFDPGPDDDIHFVGTHGAGFYTTWLRHIDSDGNYDFSATFASTGSGHADVIDMIVGTSGEVYATGPYSGTVDFDDSTGVNSLSGGGTYLAKRNADGSFAWVIKWIGVINGLTMDTAGDLYLTGGFSNTVDFDPTSGVDQKTAGANVSTYITQLKPDGSYGWTLTFSGSGQNAGNDIAIDNQGAIYVTGEFRNSVNFNTDGGNDTLTSVSGSLDGFVTKLNADTSYAWTEQFGNANNEVGQKIAVDDTANVYALDNNRGAFGSSALNTSLRKFFANGTADFVLTFDNGSGRSEGTSLSIFGNEIYVGGGYTGTVDFDPTSGSDIHTSSGSQDGFVTKVGTDGSYAWVQTLGDTQEDYVRSVLADGNGSLFIAGSFRGSADFSYGASTDIRTAVAFMDSFITRMDTDGNPMWSYTFGQNAHDWTKALAMDANGNIYQGGKVNAVASSSRRASNWDFDPGPNDDIHFVGTHGAGFYTKWLR